MKKTCQNLLVEKNREEYLLSALVMLAPCVYTRKSSKFGFVEQYTLSAGVTGRCDRRRIHAKDIIWRGQGGNFQGALAHGTTQGSTGTKQATRTRNTHPPNTGQHLTHGIPFLPSATNKNYPKYLMMGMMRREWPRVGTLVRFGEIDTCDDHDGARFWAPESWTSGLGEIGGPRD